MAKLNAPRTVLTFGRIVGRRDLEDFARGFSGVGKAKVAEVQRGESRWLLVTVASVQGKPLAPTDETWLKLEAAIAAAKEPAVRVRLVSYTERLFVLKGRLRRDPAYRLEDVQGACLGGLRFMFGFGQRDFGQPATLAEAVAAIQATPGVIAVDVDVFSPFDAIPALLPVVPAHRAEWTASEPTPADLLLIHPFDIELTEGL
jgi:hypothetical protein